MATPKRRPALHPGGAPCGAAVSRASCLLTEQAARASVARRPPIPLIASTNPVYDLRPLHFGMGYISFPTGMLVVDGKVRALPA